MDAVHLTPGAGTARERGEAGQLHIVCAPNDIPRTVRLFRTLSDDELTGLTASIQHRSYRAGAYIVRAGEESAGLYVILSGRVEILLHDEECRELILRVFGANDFFGEKTVIHGGAHSESARASEACEILYVRQKGVAEYLLRNRGTLSYIMQVVAERVRSAENRIGEFAFCDVYMRVASTLAEMSLEAIGVWIVSTSSERVSRLVGASREMVCRVIKNMIKRGLMRRHKRSLIVLDRALLVDASSRSGRGCRHLHQDLASDCLLARSQTMGPEGGQTALSLRPGPHVMAGVRSRIGQ